MTLNVDRARGLAAHLARPKLGRRRLPLHVDRSRGRAGGLRALATFRARATRSSTAISRGRPGPNDGRHPLPAVVDFAAKLGAWGIANDSTVVAYDEASGAIAARLWWLLGWLGHERSLVLDGGFAAWPPLGCR